METNMRDCLCVDIGGTFIKYGMIGPELELEEKGQTPTRFRTPEEFLDTMEALYRPFQGRARGIALSVPGVVDSGRGIFLNGAILKGIREYPMAQELERRLGIPAAVMNDAKAAAAAEARFGALKGCKTGVVLVLGTGVGGAVVIDGKVLPGAHFAAGELGYITHDADYPEDWDQEANTMAGRNGNGRLAELAAEARGIPKEGVTGYDVFRWAEEGDEAVFGALLTFSKSLVHMILNIQAILDPERFAVGGGISRQPLLFSCIEKSLDELYPRLVYPAPRPQVVACRYFNDANLIGAYSNFLALKEEGSL